MDNILNLINRTYKNKLMRKSEMSKLEKGIIYFKKIRIGYNGDSKNIKTVKREGPFKEY